MGPLSGRQWGRQAGRSSRSSSRRAPREQEFLRQADDRAGASWPLTQLAGGPGRKDGRTGSGGRWVRGAGTRGSRPARQSRVPARGARVPARTGCSVVCRLQTHALGRRSHPGSMSCLPRTDILQVRNKHLTARGGAGLVFGLAF